VSVVDDYVAGLDGALRGPRRVKADLVAEARHSLADATDAFKREGLSGDRAARRAVAEFGSYAEVVPGYQAELAVAQGRRTALLFGTALVALRYLTPLIWAGTPWTRTTSATSGYLLVATGFDYLALVGAAGAAVAWLLLGWGSRYLPDSAGVVRVVGRAAMVFLGLHGVVGLTIYTWSLSRWPAFLHWPPMWAGIVITNTMFVCAIVCAWRCVALSRTPRLAATTG